MYIERAPNNPIMIKEIDRKRLLPEGLKIMIKEKRRTEIVRLAINSILYRSSLLISHSIIFL
jgi:hypothetical protein